MNERGDTAVEKQSILESITGGLTVQAVATGLAATSAAAYAPVGVVLLPVLANALANGRYQQRVQNELNRLDAELQQLQGKVEQLTDAQFMFVKEIYLTLTQTHDEEKLKYLSNVIRYGIRDHEMRFGEASILSRIIRDISGEEIKFIHEFFRFDAVTVLTTESEEDKAKYAADNWGTIASNSYTQTIITGLISLGLLKAESTWSETYKFTPAVAKLIAVISNH